MANTALYEREIEHLNAKKTAIEGKLAQNFQISAE